MQTHLSGTLTVTFTLTPSHHLFVPRMTSEYRTIDFRLAVICTLFTVHVIYGFHGNLGLTTLWIHPEIESWVAGESALPHLHTFGE